MGLRKEPIHQTRLTLYWSKIFSLLTIDISSSSACAISIRSKGSWCGPGNIPARIPCSQVTASSRNLSPSRYPRKSFTSSEALDNLPLRNFVAISQEETALT